MLFNDQKDIKNFIQNKDNYTIISKETPLISNLDITENISIIKEVHEFMPAKKANKITAKYLQKLNLSNISLYRPIRCSDLEILQVMLIRASMCKNQNIVIINPHYLINNLKDIKVIIENMKMMKDKDLLILDTISNEVYYKGCSCHIVK